jgi:hypothetical protein
LAPIRVEYPKSYGLKGPATVSLTTYRTGIMEVTYIPSHVFNYHPLELEGGNDLLRKQFKTTKSFFYIVPEYCCSI